MGTIAQQPWVMNRRTRRIHRRGRGGGQERCNLDQVPRGERRYLTHEQAEAAYYDGAQWCRWCARAMADRDW